METLAFSLSSKTHLKIMQSVGELLSKSKVRLKDFTVRAFDDAYHITGSVHGSWDSLAKLEVLLSKFAEKFKCHLQIWRPYRKDKPVGLPYILEATFVEDTGKTVSSLMSMFAELGIFIDGVDCHSTPMEQDQIFLARVQYRLKLPLQLNVQFVRERFYGLCDDLNIDGTLELCQG